MSTSARTTAATACTAASALSRQAGGPRAPNTLHAVRRFLPDGAVSSNLTLYRAYLRWARTFACVRLRRKLTRNVQESFRFRHAYFDALLQDAAEASQEEAEVRRVVCELDEHLRHEASEVLRVLGGVHREASTLLQGVVKWKARDDGGGGGARDRGGSQRWLHTAEARSA